MGLNRTLHKLFKRLTGLYIVRRWPHGLDISYDIKRLCKGYRFDCIFDVGANVGQSASDYMSAYPSSTVFCFEPITETFKQLQKNMKGKSRVKCFQLAFAAIAEKRMMTSEATSTLNCFVDENSNADTENKKQELVETSTLDDFFESQKMSHISYLKIDTEGGDLDVLIGAANLLNMKSIDFVEVESGMNSTNQSHVPFENLKRFLENQGYSLFGIYEQFSEWPKMKPHLRRVNAVFISEKMIGKYTAT